MPTFDSDSAGLADILLRAAESGGAVVHVAADGARVVQTYRDLADDAARVAAGLLDMGAKRGSPIVLPIDSSRDFAAAFWACALGGFVAVPFVAPPTYEDALHVRRLASACAVLGAPIVVAADEVAHAIQNALARSSSAARVADLTTLRSALPRTVEPARDDERAMILFTSGTSEAPKAVVHHHRSIIAACRAKSEALGVTGKDVFVSWLPLHHVGSLVRMHVLPAFAGATQVQIATPWVVADPLRWIDALAAERATVSWAPNFAFALVTDRAGARRAWDLSSVRCLVAAAEPVVAATIVAFERLLAPHGLRPGVVRASWGMTETCSGITYSDAVSRHPEVRHIDVGRPIAGTSVRIVDDQDRLVGDGVTGRVQVRGTTVMAGYLDAGDLTREAFTPDGWLDSGDLGCLRAGALSITGRAKDVIIINGRNLSPLEVEQALAGVPGLDAVVAAAVRTAGANTDDLAVFVQARDATARGPLAAEISRRILRSFGVAPAHVIAHGDLRAGGVGKVRRADLVRRFQAGALVSIAIAPAPLEAREARRDTATILVELCCELGLPATAPTDDLFDLGAHSLALAQLLARIQSTLGVPLAIGTVFDHSTLDALAEQIDKARPAASSAPVLGPTSSRRERLLPPQRGTLFVDRDDPTNRVCRFVRSAILDGALDPAPLQRALFAMIERQHSLRTRYIEAEDGLWQETIAPDGLGQIEHVDLSAYTGDELLRKEAAVHDEFVQRPFALSRGEVVRALLIAHGPTRHRFTTVLHRIGCGPVSAGVFDEELHALWRAATDPASSEVLPPPPLQFLDLVNYLARVAASPVGAEQRAYWQQRLAGAVPLQLPADLPRERVDARRAAGGEFVTFPHGVTVATIEAEGAASLEQLARQTSTSTLVVLLAVLAAQFTRLTGQRDLTFVSHLSYRHWPGLDRTIGQFANPLLMRVSTDGDPDFRTLIARTHEVVTTAFDHADADVLGMAPHLFRVFFNYMYVGDASVDVTPPDGLVRSVTAIPGGHGGGSAYDLILSVVHSAQQIRLHLFYNADLFHHDGATRLLADYVSDVSKHVESR